MTNIVSTRTRSWLFTTATRPDRFAKAAAAGADVAILDLEDAVAPKDKAAARTTALQYLTDTPAQGALRALRINGLDTVALGFTAKAAIHPAQIAAINEALTPSAEAVVKARAILSENAKGVGSVDGQMIDQAIARKAHQTLAAAGLNA